MRSRGMLNKRPNTTAKGKRILIAFHAQKYKILSTGIPKSAITIPSTLLSIAAGTVCYMLLVQLVF